MTRARCIVLATFLAGAPILAESTSKKGDVIFTSAEHTYENGNIISAKSTRTDTETLFVAIRPEEASPITNKPSIKLSTTPKWDPFPTGDPVWTLVTQPAGTPTFEKKTAVSFSYELEGLGYYKFKATHIESASVGIQLFILDLDIDSDNIYGFSLPKDTLEEEIAEDSSEFGKLIMVHDSYLDDDKVPGFADGYDLGQVDGDATLSEGNFVPLVVRFPKVSGLEDAEITIEYNESDPSGVAVTPITDADGNTRYEFKPATPTKSGGAIRIWTKDATESRLKAPLSTESLGGNFIKSGQPFKPEGIGITEDIREATLYIEGIFPSDSLADCEIKILIDPDGADVDTYKPIETDSVKVTLLKVDLEWEAQDEDNPVDVNPNEGGGKRYYPGKVLPTESNPRNLVMLKVKVPGLTGKKVKLKSFDVDDPTVDVLPFFDADVVDPNQNAGDDNFDDYLNTPKSGEFVLGSASSPTATVTLDENGEAEIDFRVGMQPGNNYRVVAVLEDHQGNFDQLQVGNSSADAFVSADDQPIAGFTGAGAASPMLTVWRKLHIEQDSMGEVPNSGSEKNFIKGTIADVTPENGANGAVIDLNKVFSGYVTDEFVKGRLVIDGQAEFDSDGFPVYEVTASTVGAIVTMPGGTIIETATVTVIADPGSSAVGKNFKLYDDDERGLPSSHQPLLPIFDLITNAVSDKFSPAYITVLDADSLNLNPNKLVSFERNNSPTSVLSNVANDSEDLASYADDELFWCLLVTASFQGAIDEDEDPETEPPPTEGELLENAYGLSPAFAVIHLESIRDIFLQLNGRSLSQISALQSEFVKRIVEVVSHEIGHGPIGSGREHHHDEGYLMGKGIQGANFGAETVKRFRETETWR